jgi:hypothetical protein
MARFRFQTAASTLISLIATRMGLEPILAVLGIGPSAIAASGDQMAEQQHAMLGFRLLWMGTACLIASGFRSILRSLREVPMLACAVELCGRSIRRSASE